MSSILTNNSAMNALQTLRSVNNNLNETQNRISTGMKVNSAKDNAAYFSISETMKGDSGMTKSINESLTLTKNSLATARVGADSVKDLAKEFVERVAFAQASGSDVASIDVELKEIGKRMDASISQATFNGDDLISSDNTTSADAAVNAETGAFTAPTMTNTAREMDVVTGISRSGGTFAATTMKVSGVDLQEINLSFAALAEKFSTNYNAITGTTNVEKAEKQATYLENTLIAAEGLLTKSVKAATTLGVGEKSIENQQTFLTKLTDNLDAGVGAMVDADMEEEAARLQSLQVQQQLATQSLSIANQAPQNILSLFR
jgi:flagellin